MTEATTSQSPIRVLLIEDRAQDAEFIEMMLKRSPEITVTVQQATTLSKAVDACHVMSFDVMLLDLGLPDSPGVEAVTTLRTHAPEIPIVVLTGDDRDQTAIQAINAGAQDYLPKQHVVGSLLARILKHSIARQLRLNRANLDALIDSLTGIGNRRSFDSELDRRISDFTRHRFPFCIALFDIDNFKGINDQWGHSIGDAIIKSVAEAISSRGRKSDHFSRYGGEEFSVVMPMTPIDGATLAARRCVARTKLAKATEHHLSVTISAGLTQVAKSDTAESIVERADAALYEAKRRGRDRLIVSHQGKFIEVESGPDDESELSDVSSCDS
ncbi:Response regulator PleD [Rubripirellula obstinata]|uniref:diguanylate cyclase n=1 Tax=Rubripirellula obstinata TaxID=406547 RepID=A0A5B1CFN5_9BACT|nr:diguanylate cyclase [Rubripirellula obstinata]KAA1258725.1 Response regulator PleD [Rubripirellula obstinata]